MVRTHRPKDPGRRGHRPASPVSRDLSSSSILPLWPSRGSADLRCTSCFADNRAERRYCARCGRLLPVACPICGFSNGPSDAYCGGCGIQLSRDAAQATQAPDEVPLRQGECRSHPGPDGFEAHD
ncbi:zinc ribbon domain-containing protein [Microvirga massiliensis]|uniref:double zinc ribbon domain-containing protein n=1 Tax=Microvirga massiliensis TaxID=1033741 RepID=UPI0009E62DF1